MVNIKSFRGLFLGVLVSVLMVGCSHKYDTDLQKPPIQDEISEENEDQDTEGEAEEPPVIELTTAEMILGQMSLEEKIAQMFIVDFYGYVGEDLTQADDRLLEQLKTYPIGGVIFFAKNLVDRQQTTGFVEKLQAAANIPLWISVDEEGGIVSRLQKNPAMNMTKMPSQGEIGDTLDPYTAYEAALTIGSEIKELGFNMDFAPVADVNTNPDNPVIGERAYSNDQNMVADMVVEAVKGFQETGVVPVIKHFPGHGDTIADTHTGAVYVEHDLARLQEIELVPFQRAIESGAQAVMVAHISLPKITGNDIPATMSKDIVGGVLREKLGFDGVVITDALNMGAISETYSSDVASVEAIKAGVDILLMPKDFTLAFNGVLEAVKTGEISEARINESVMRILKLKIANQIIARP